MMNSNKAPVAGVEVKKKGVGNGNDENQLSDENVTVSRLFGVMDLWRIRNNARSFRIHSRIPRL